MAEYFAYSTSPCLPLWSGNAFSGEGESSLSCVGKHIRTSCLAASPWGPPCSSSQNSRPLVAFVLLVEREQRALSSSALAVRVCVCLFMRTRTCAEVNTTNVCVCVSWVSQKFLEGRDHPLVYLCSELGAQLTLSLYLETHWGLFSFKHPLAVWGETSYFTDFGQHL